MMYRQEMKTALPGFQEEIVLLKPERAVMCLGSHRESLTTVVQRHGLEHGAVVLSGQRQETMFFFNASP